MSTQLDRIEELLAQRVSAGLSGKEAAELEKLLERAPAANAASFERAAAAVHVAAISHLEPPPAHLRKRLEADAQAFFAGRTTGPEQAVRVRPRSRTTWPWPWLATAAALLIAVASWWPAIVGVSNRDMTAQRAALIASGVAVLPWTATDDPAAADASGDVVWSEREHAGFMRIAMLAPSESADFQYQLWIFDADRDERYPVDGGVFDVPSGVSEVIVPIRASLPVASAALFAVTVERRGGVVVSSRDRIVLVARADDSA